MNKVSPGFYLVSFAKKDTSVLGFGDQEVIVTEPKDPRVFLELCRAEIGKRYPLDEFAIIAVSRLS